jgi:hypothetical protein
MKNSIYDLTNTWTKGQRTSFSHYLNTFHRETKWNVTIRREHGILMAHCYPKVEGHTPFTIEFGGHVAKR